MPTMEEWVECRASKRGYTIDGSWIRKDERETENKGSYSASNTEGGYVKYRVEEKEEINDIIIRDMGK